MGLTGAILGGGQEGLGRGVVVEAIAASSEAQRSYQAPQNPS